MDTEQDTKVINQNKEMNHYYPTLTPGAYYYHKPTNNTMRFDGWAMQYWTYDWEDGVPRVCWDDVPPVNELEEATWGTKYIPLHDFSACEHY